MAKKSRRNDNLIYQCECGSTEFHLFRDGRVGCVECDDFFSNVTVEFPAGIPVCEHHDG